MSTYQRIISANCIRQGRGSRSSALRIRSTKQKLLLHKDEIMIIGKKSLSVCLLLLAFAIIPFSLKAEDILRSYFNKGSLSHRYFYINYQENLEPNAFKNALKRSARVSFQWERSAFFPASNGVLLRLAKGSTPSRYSEWQEMREQIAEFTIVHSINPCFQYGTEVPVAVMDNVFLKVQRDVSAAEVKDIVQSNGGTYRGEHGTLPNVHVASLGTASQNTPVRFCHKLRNHEAFAYVEPDVLFSPAVPKATTNDSLFDRQWHMDNQGTSQQHNGTVDADMDVTEAWSITTGSPSITIGLLDSGVDTSHADLKGNLLPGYDGTDQSKKGYPNDSFPDDGHGTACAGILSGLANNQIGVAGVAYDCEILPVRIFYYRDFGGQIGVIPFSRGSWMIDGINWAFQQADADVLSNAWGVPDSLMPLLTNIPGPVNDAINQAVSNGRGGLGLPMLFSTGNADIDKPLWPSRRSNTIAVTATSMCDERKSNTSCDGETWWGGNYGKGTDVAAPGVKIPTTDRQGAEGYEPGSYKLDFNGTSAACPNAAAVVALMLSVNPNLSLRQIEDILASTADTVGGYAYDTLNEYGPWSQELGYGRVNAHQAVQKASSITHVGSDASTTTVKPGLHVHPNPASSKAHIQLTNWPEGTVSLILRDLMGRKIMGLFHEDITESRQEVHVSLENRNVSTGMYILEVRHPEARKVKKLMIDESGAGK